MSEVKRAVLNPLEPQKLGAKPSKKYDPTVRISVTLAPSTEDTCPEFNYKELLAASKKKLKVEKEPNGLENGLDPFGDDDGDVKRIAMEMEAKYGTSSGVGKKKKKGRRDDYADIGMGYDESDSFIDNTDGYDEIIPANVTTLCGGFYINSGALVFKTDDEATSDYSSSSSDSEGEGKIVKRKRVLDTSSDEDSNENKSEKSKLQTGKKLKLMATKNSMQQAIKKKLFSPKKIQVKKRRPIDPIKRTVKDLLREKRQDLNMSIPTDLVPENAEKDSSKENKKPMSLESVADAIEAVIKDTAKYESESTARTTEVVAKVAETPKNVPGASSSQENLKPENEIVILPENLPSNILDIINNIKKAANDYKDCGKVKFFTDEVNAMLLSLERNCKCLGKSSRLKVYDHLAPFVKCKKDTLIRRAKNLILDDEMKKLKSLLMKLKAQINTAMSTFLVQYERECQKVQMRNLESTDSDETKKARMPKRKFHCSEDMKKLLKDILSIKKRCLVLEGKAKNTLEETLQEFLKQDIQAMWPEGWMSLVSLRKLCNSLKTPQKAPGDAQNPPKHSQNSAAASALTIIPIDTGSSGIVSKVAPLIPNDVSISRIVDNNVQKPSNAEMKALQQLKESGVIVVNKSKGEDVNKPEKETVILPKPPHCQIINLADKKDEERAFSFVKESEVLMKNHVESKPPEISISSSSVAKSDKMQDGDDIQRVMENLKALQKLSSPSKPDGGGSSSPVSVIAVNRSFSPKSSLSQGSNARNLNGRPDLAQAAFQRDEFQRQFVNSLSQMPPATQSKPNITFELQ